MHLLLNFELCALYLISLQCTTMNERKITRKFQTNTRTRTGTHPHYIDDSFSVSISRMYRKCLAISSYQYNSWRWKMARTRSSRRHHSCSNQTTNSVHWILKWINWLLKRMYRSHTIMWTCECTALHAPTPFLSISIVFVSCLSFTPISALFHNQHLILPVRSPCPSPAPPIDTI